MPVGMYDWVNRSQLMALGIRSLCLPLRNLISDVGYLSAATPQAAAPIAAAFFKSASAILMLAMSMRRPSSDTAPFPALAASAIALTMRRALVTSASDGVNT